MVLKVRHPEVEDMFCTFDADSAETLPVAAGRLVYVTGMTTDGRAKVQVITAASSQTVLGWLMHKVKDVPADFPPGFVFRGDLGSTDIREGDPCGVAHGPGAVYETDQYVDEGSNGITAGTVLYSDNDGKLSDTNADSGTAAAVAMQTLTATETAAGKLLRIKALI